MNEQLMLMFRRIHENMKFYYKPTKNSKGYAAIKINVCYQTMKKVAVIVNLLTGVILVKGEIP